MKKILLAVTAALAITSCSQNEEFEAPSQKAEINFNTAVTRATELNTNGLQKAGFEIYAYNTGTSGMTADVVLPAEAWISNSARWWSILLASNGQITIFCIFSKGRSRIYCAKCF